MSDYTVENDEESIYGFEFVDNSGKTISLESFKNKTLLIVNTASQCGMTPQYAELQELYNKYKDSGFEIIAFPCNQFGQQEPGTDEEIVNFCSKNYGVTFTIGTKIDVNGNDAHPLYKYLVKINPKNGKEIQWNFEKFLVLKDGSIGNYDHRTTPFELEEFIKKDLI